MALRRSITHLFETFERTGSATATVKHFRAQGLRSYVAEHYGAAPTQLHHPAHAATPRLRGAARGHAEQAIERLVATRCCRAAFLRMASSSGT